MYRNNIYEKIWSQSNNNHSVNTLTCWNAKFEKKMGAPTKVNGSLDPDTIAASFVNHFKAVCTD